MWLFIAMLCVIMMFLLNLAINKAGAFEKEKDELNARICELAGQLRDITQENAELRKLRMQEVHNNTVLVNKNRELQAFKYAIEDIVNGNRTAEEKMDKIIELLDRKIR